MKIQVRYFASLRESLGAAEAIEMPEGSTMRSLRELLQQRSPMHAAALASDRAVRCALDQRLCAEDVALADGAEVAFFPPVTGG
jgi:molybdopterin synthase sulfur carrier subunit